MLRNLFAQAVQGAQAATPAIPARHAKGHDRVLQLDTQMENLTLEERIAMLESQVNELIDDHLALEAIVGGIQIRLSPVLNEGSDGQTVDED